MELLERTQEFGLQIDSNSEHVSYKCEGVTIEYAIRGVEHGDPYVYLWLLEKEDGVCKKVVDRVFRSFLARCDVFNLEISLDCVPFVIEGVSDTFESRLEAMEKLTARYREFGFQVDFKDVDEGNMDEMCTGMTRPPEIAF